MSNAQFKPCTRCKTIIQLSNKSSLCNACRALKYQERKEYLKQTADQSDIQKIYNKSRYRKAKKECMRRAEGKCEVCNHFGRKKLATHCHHIIKVKDGNEYTHYNIDNLIASCNDCHKIIEGMNKEELITYLESKGEV